MRSLWVVAVLALLPGCVCLSGPIVCGPNNCEGCCDAAGACKPGTTSAVCGKGANTCRACPSAQTCEAKVCTAASASGFTLTDLDASALDATYLSMAIDRTQDRVGVAYFTNAGTQTLVGVPDYDLKYLEWRAGVTSTPQKIRTVQRLVGVALGFDPATNEPVVSYLGGGSDTSLFWLQSDAVLNRRTAGVTWTETAVATMGNQVTCNNPISDRGFLVGLWPTFTWDSTGKLYFAYRDAHQGQSGVQDWEGSDLELWETGFPPTVGTCLAPGDGAGGHSQLVMGLNDQPAIVYDRMPTGADVAPANVYFQRRTAAGTWTPRSSLITLSNVQSGPSLAWDAQEGFGVAVQDRSTNQLLYFSSLDGNFGASDLVFGAGSGGWFPSLAMDPVNHEPAIAFTVCSPQDGVSESSCLTSQDELRVAQRSGTRWNQVVVDVGGGAMPKLGFLSSGKRVVVYRTPPAIDSATSLPVMAPGKLKLAVER